MTISTRTKWGLIVLLAYSLFVGIKLIGYQFDVSRFIVAGDRFVDRGALTLPIAVEPHSTGYDGQFYYRLALAPATAKRTDRGITIDNPAVRGQRILYPAAAWLLSLGHGRAVPALLVLINLAAIVGIGWVGAGLAGEAGLPIWTGALFAFYPGFLLSLTRDTPEPFAALLALLAVLAATRQRYGLAALAASLAVLTKETTLCYLAGFGVVALIGSISKRRLDPALPWYVVPVIVYLAWQAVLRTNWGSFAVDDIGRHDFSGVPLHDYIAWIGHYSAGMASVPLRYRLFYSFATCVLVAVFAGLVVRRASFRATAVRPVLISWACYGLMAIFFTDAVWNEPYGYLRVLCDFYGLGLAAIVAGGDRRTLRALAPAVAVTWIATAAYA